jgi:hypothetical protein
VQLARDTASLVQPAHSHLSVHAAGSIEVNGLPAAEGTAGDRIVARGDTWLTVAVSYRVGLEAGSVVRFDDDGGSISLHFESGRATLATADTGLVVHGSNWTAVVDPGSVAMVASVRGATVFNVVEGLMAVTTQDGTRHEVRPFDAALFVPPAVSEPIQEPGTSHTLDIATGTPSGPPAGGGPPGDGPASSSNAPGGAGAPGAASDTGQRDGDDPGTTSTGSGADQTPPGVAGSGSPASDPPEADGPPSNPGGGPPADPPGNGTPPSKPGGGPPADPPGDGTPPSNPGGGPPADPPGKGTPPSNPGGGPPADPPGKGTPPSNPGGGGGGGGGASAGGSPAGLAIGCTGGATGTPSSDATTTPGDSPGKSGSAPGQVKKASST